MLRFVFAIVIVYSIGSYASFAAVVDADSALAGVTPQDHNFLRYFYFKNQFDSAMVSYRFGEVKLIVNDTARRVYLSSLLAENSFVQGDSIQGVMSNLLGYSRTENFIMPASGTISYYAHLSTLRLPCDANIDTSNKGGGCDEATYGDSRWLVGVNKIQDRTEFVVQLLRASDDAVLATYDSLGIAPNPNCIYADVYGSSAGFTKHSFAIPVGYQSEPAYLRISPRRYGPTPYGIILLNEATKFMALSYSTDDLGYKKHAAYSNDSAYFHQYVWKRITEYFDSTAYQTGHYPAMIPRYVFDYGIDTLYYNKYFDKRISSAGKEYRVLKEYNGLVKASSKTENYLKYVNVPSSSLKEFEITDIYPNPSDGSNITVQLKGAYNTIGVYANILTLAGRKIGTPWYGSIVKGVSSVSFSLGDYSSGSYLLCFINNVGQLVDVRKIIIRK